MNTISGNVLINEDSFIYCLYKKDLFRIDLLSELIIEITEMTHSYVNGTINDKEVLNNLEHLFFIYSKTNDALIAHFHENDLFRIKELDENFLTYLARLRFVFKMLLKKDYNGILEYEDEFGRILPPARRGL
jgi:hypothetical protein